MLVDLITAIIRRGGLFNLGEEFRKVIQLEWRLMLLQKRHHLPRNVTFIEAVARGDDSAARPLGAAARSALTMSVNVFARGGSLIVSPGLYIEPSGFRQ